MNNIKGLLKHREPFLFVDKLEINKDDEIIGYKVFKATDFFFKGHFPDYPIVPGVILVETMVQCGGAGAKLIIPNGDSLFYLIKIEKARFFKELHPEEECKIIINNIRISNKIISQSGKIFYCENKVAEAEWICVAK